MVPISTELFNVSLLKTVSPIIKTINSKTERALKYPHPYTKVMLNNTAKINTDTRYRIFRTPYIIQKLLHRHLPNSEFIKLLLWESTDNPFLLLAQYNHELLRPEKYHVHSFV